MAIRTSVLAEIKVLSLAGLASWANENNTSLSNKDAIGGGKPANAKEALAKFRAAGAESPNDPVTKMKNLFRTVGLATSLQIDENYGTTAIHGIGGPTRPKVIPGNYQATISIEKIQLDRRDNFSYITSPEYWYSVSTQRKLGVDNDWALYSYICLWDREQKIDNLMDQEIYCMMPQSARKGITTQDTMISHNVSMIGFKYRYEDVLELLWDASRDSILDYGRTVAGNGYFPFGGSFTPKGTVQGKTNRAAGGNNAGGA